MAFDHAFKHLTADDRHRLLDGAVRRLMPAGTTIVHQDAVMDSLFVVGAGTVKVQRSIPVMRYAVPSGLPRSERNAYVKTHPQAMRRAHLGVTLGRLGAGAIFGELSFLDREPTSAAVVAESPVSILLLEGAHIRSLTEEDHGFAARFYQSLALALAQRVRSLNRKVERNR